MPASSRAVSVAYAAATIGFIERDPSVKHNSLPFNIAKQLFAADFRWSKSAFHTCHAEPAQRFQLQYSQALISYKHCFDTPQILANVIERGSPKILVVTTRKIMRKQNRKTNKMTR